MSTENLATGAVEIMKRVDNENTLKSAQQIALDGSNKVSFPGYPYIFEALGEKILVSIDVFKSGYECRVCKGTKVIKITCECESSGRKGKRYKDSEIEEFKKVFGDSLAFERASMTCPECSGFYNEHRREETCEACKGIGHTLILPESSKNLPTTGVVVSMGRDAKERAQFKIGDRILFGPYAGTMIPTKAGLMFKIMDWNLAWTIIEGAEDMGAFDFILQTED
jgi:co-chaperonin GroES (HSP10)